MNIVRDGKGWLILIKTKVIVFRNSGRLTALTKLYYNNGELEIDGKFTYLGIVFSTEQNRTER